MNIGPEPYTLQKRMGVVRESYQKECSGKGKNIYMELIKQPERNRSNGIKKGFFSQKKYIIPVYTYVTMYSIDGPVFLLDRYQQRWRHF